MNMRKITFQADKQIKVRVDGLLVQGAVLDLEQVRGAKRMKLWTPFMEQTFAKQLETKLRNFGMQDDEIMVIVTRFKAEMAEA
jgi:hypothetical protein